jgi:hypothetical protein
MPEAVQNIASGNDQFEFGVLFFVGLKHILAYTTFWADKVFWKLFEGDFIVLSGIVDPTAGNALIFLHGLPPLVGFFMNFKVCL